MGEHPNAARVREGYAAFATGDMPKLDELFADDIIWHVGGDNMLTGDYKGKAEVFSHFARLGQEMSGLTLDVEDVMANDRHAAALIHTTASRGDKRLDSREMHLFQISPDSKVTEFTSFPEDLAKLDHFFS